MSSTLSGERQSPAAIPPTVSNPPVPENIAVSRSTDPEIEELHTHNHNQVNRHSVFTLLQDLMDETRLLIRQEIKLVKAEMSEKLSHFGRNAVFLGIGATIAFAGAIVLLIGLGYLAAWAIQLAGVAGLLAAFIGIGGLGLVVVITGGALVLKGLSGMKAESLSPERTLQTLQGLKGGPVVDRAKTPETPSEPRPSPEEMQSRVEATEEEMGETLEALRDRLSPRNISARVKQRISVHPYRSGLIAMGAGLLSGLAIRWRLGRASA